MYKFISQLKVFVIKKLYFFSLDYDRKIEVLSRVTKINLLPKSSYSFFRNIYDFFILKEIYKFNSINFKKIKKFKKLNKNILVINVRSGSTYLTKTLNEYITTLNYQSKKNYNQRYVISNNFYKLDRNFFLDNIDKNKISNFIFSSRYPNGRKSVFFNNDIHKLVLVLRHPLSWIRSYFLYNHCYREDNLHENVYQKYPIIEKITSKKLNYLKSIDKILSKETCIIKYEDIIDKPINEVKKIINYFNLNLNENILIDILHQNKKSKLSKQIFYNNRISPDLDEELNNFIKDKIEKNINYKKVIKIYNKILITQNLI